MRGLSSHRRVGQVVSGCVLVALVLAACAPGVRPPASRSTDGRLTPPAAVRVEVGSGVRVLQGALPVPFEENHGQAAPEAAFLFRAGSLQAAFGARGVRYTLLTRDPADAADTTAPIPAPPGLPDVAGPLRGYTVEQQLVGARPVAPIGAQPSPTRVNYLNGPADQWQTDLPTYDQLLRQDAWPGVDVLYERNGTGVESTYVVAPGADPSQIQFTWRGATAVLTEDGMLQLETPLGTIQETAPIAWQVRDGRRGPVSVAWAATDVGGEETVWTFTLGAYDPDLALIVDPTVLSYGTFVGGSGIDAATRVALDGSGAAYVCGYTVSTQATFPNGNGFGLVVGQVNVPGLDQTFNAGVEDAFVAKLAPNGQSLVYVTYIGGGLDDVARDIAVDSTGAAYIAGYTSSTQTTFPNGSGFGMGVGQVDVPGFDQTHNGGTYDAFVLKLAPNGQSLLYATYIGGNSSEFAFSIAIDSSGSAYVTGQTFSTETSFPNGTGLGGLGVPGFDQFQNGGSDAFLVKLTPDGQSLVYASYIGGSANDQGIDVAVDSTGAAYVVGFTASAEATFPNGGGLVMLGAPGFDQSYNGGIEDAFVIKLGPSGSTVAYVTYLGGSGGDIPLGIALDSSGSAYVTGQTASTETSFPNGGGLAGLNLPGFDQTYNGGTSDAFAIKLRPSGTSIDYLTYIGGSGGDLGLAIAVDGDGSAYVAGSTGSTETTFPNGTGFAGLSGFPGPGLPGFDQTYNGGTGDGFVVKLTPAGHALFDATYLGGSASDQASGIAVNSAGEAYVVGLTVSTETTFPNGTGFGVLGVPGFDQTHNGGTYDAIAVKLAPTVTATPTATGTPTGTPTPTLTPLPTTTPFACGPRPTVSVNAVAAGPGRLQVTVSSSTAPATPGNRLTQLTASIPPNARVDVQGGPQDLSGDVPLPIGDGTQPIVFFVRRTGPGGIQVPVVATDTCGTWPSFVGGGPNAF